MPIGRPFADRRDAGRRLGAALAPYAGTDAVVLALPRGGVPVGYEVARALRAALDLLFVRKLGVPGHPELGLGALVDGSDPQVVLNEEVTRQVRLPEGYLEAVKQKELAEIERRRRAYIGDRQPISVRGRTAIVVDDGIATGGTVRAALKGLAGAGAARIVLAVPVAPPDVLDLLRSEADEVVCLAAPEPFIAVGLWYADFTQTRDAEVIELLRQAEAETRRTSDEGGRTDDPGSADRFAR